MIVQINDNQDWQNLVVKNQCPVVVNFYADWCKPCEKLNPILNDAAKENQGKWVLAQVNVDIDEVQDISAQIVVPLLNFICSYIELKNTLSLLLLKRNKDS